jgi:hypothetical protein
MLRVALFVASAFAAATPAWAAAIDPKTRDAIDQSVKEYCKREWPNKPSMEAYCEKNEWDAVNVLFKGKPDDILQDQFDGIRRSCTEEWKNRFTMRAYCERSEFDAIRELKWPAPDDIAPAEFAEVRAQCRSKWQNNRTSPESQFGMMVYCEKGEIASIRERRHPTVPIAIGQ